MAETGSENLGSVELEEQKPASDVVKVKVKCNKDGKETYYLINRRAQIRKLLQNFCRHASVDYRSTRFIINQRPFSHDKTPNQLGLCNGDQVDALIDGNGA